MFKKICPILFILFYFSVSLYSQNQTTIDSLKQELKTTIDTQRVNILLDISRLYFHTKKDSSLQYAELAKIDVEQLNSVSHAAEVYYLLGVISVFTEKYIDAEFYLQKAKKIYKKTGNKGGLIRCFDKIGLIYLKKSNFPKAIECYTDELTLAEEVGNKSAQAYSINNIAIVYYKEKNYDVALEYYLKAFDINKQISNKQGIALGYNNIGEIYKIRKSYKIALNYYLEALNIFEEINYKSGIAYSSCNLCEIYLSTNEIEQAKESILYAKNIFEKLNDSYGLAEVYNNLGEIYCEQKNYTQAIKYFQHSQRYANRIGSSDQIIDNYLKLSILFQEKDDFSEALYYYKKYSEERENIFNSSKSQIINQLKINYETEKKDKKIGILSREAKLNKLKNTQHKRVILIQIISLIFLLTVSIIILIQKRNKNHAFKELVKRNLEIMNTNNEMVGTKIKYEKLLKEYNKKNKISSVDKSDKYDKSPLTEVHKQELFDELILLMEEEKYYLERNINLTKISKLLETNNLYLSQVINQKTNFNFNSLINSYRINESRKLLTNSNFSHYSIEGIAKEVGFKSKSTFNTAFKKFTGVTPSFFRKQATEEN